MFKPIGGGAKALKQKKFKLDASALFQAVIDFLRKQLRSPPSEPLVRHTTRARLLSTLTHVRMHQWMHEYVYTCTSLVLVCRIGLPTTSRGDCVRSLQGM